MCKKIQLGLVNLLIIMNEILKLIRKHLFLRGFSKRVVAAYLESLKDNLISIVLFGSHARGGARPESDYDLFIICKQLPEDPLERSAYIREPIFGKFKEKIATISKTQKELESGFPSLYLDLGLDGIILYDNNYFTKKREIILKLINQAGLFREKIGNVFRWRWQRQPLGIWEINWGGVSAK